MFYDFDYSCIGMLPDQKKHTVGATHIRAERTLHLMIRSLLSGSGLGGNVPERLELFVSLDVGGRHRRGT
jgi:hypothetical protein